MSVYKRPFLGSEDIRPMIELAAAGGDRALHVADLPYRLCSWALDELENVGIWVDREGQLVGWAVLQFPFWTFDIAVHPGAEPDLFDVAVEWAVGRAMSLLGTDSERPSWFVLVFSGQSERQRALEEAGFTCQADVGEDSWSQVLLVREAAPAPALPSVSGFTIRPLAGLAEVEAYVNAHRAAFGSANMTADWRTRTLGAPRHLPSADLVAVAGDGRLVGFCIGWLHPATQTGRIEPLGVLPEFYQQGLGSALLGECLTQLTASGASRIVVSTDSYRDPARALYESAGFVVSRTILVYRKDFSAS